LLLLAARPPSSASWCFLHLLKWLGAVYLAYLGITALLSKRTEISVSGAASASSPRRLFAQGFLVGASNPKALLFFGALFPQFIAPSAPQLPQFLLLGLTFVFFELLWLTIYAASAARAKNWLQQPRRATLFNRITGAVFLFAAGILATSKRSAA
jgi:threonine/homoserine/homoserine lactone efflux protein